MRFDLFFEYFRIYIQTRMMYRIDFWVEIVTDMMFQMVNLAVIVVAYKLTPTILGWSQAELFFVYGFFMVPYSFFTTFFNLWNFADRYIVKGEFDRVLTRPMNSIVQLSFENLDPSSLAGAVTGVVIMYFSAQTIGIQWQLLDLVAFFVSVVGGILIYAGIYLFMISLSFFTDAQTGIMPLIWNIQNYGKFPMDIYNKMIRVLLTWVVPFAFVGVYPAAFFLRRDGLSLWLTPVIGLIILSIALVIWRFGERSYRGAGS